MAKEVGILIRGVQDDVPADRIAYLVDSVLGSMKGATVEVLGEAPDGSTVASVAVDPAEPQTAPAAVVLTIEDVIRDLDPKDDTLWTADGRPQVSAIAERLGRTVTADERDSAFSAVLESDEPKGEGD